MKQSKFAKKRLAVYISAALIAGLNTNVMAEEAALTEYLRFIRFSNRKNG